MAPMPERMYYMDYLELMAQLESLGSEQTRKTYRKHGVLGPQFGVSYANLDKLAKQLKKDKTLDQTALAGQLWASANHDARILATKIADPARVDRSTIDIWANELDNYAITDAFGVLIAQTPFAVECMQAWLDLPGEWISAAGWNLLGELAIHNLDLPDAFFTPYLAEIQAQIHARPNRTRYSMNNALIAIGTRNQELEEEALAVASQVGEVYVDHGETNCRTPFAADYIHKTWAYKEKRASGIKR
jgi:3-methyladenine DNA glycosylase AlkD